MLQYHTGSNPVLTTKNKNKIMIITYIVNTLFIIIILFIIWFVVCSIIYKDKPSNDLTGQSERQKRNDDYNNDYYP
jgi:flagellar biosynthesis/type III secretory pathway M-ring protein FliF/YscJ